MRNYYLILRQIAAGIISDPILRLTLRLVTVIAAVIGAAGTIALVTIAVMG
jgi:hypothetical protein